MQRRARRAVDDLDRLVQPRPARVLRQVHAPLRRCRVAQAVRVGAEEVRPGHVETQQQDSRGAGAARALQRQHPAVHHRPADLRHTDLFHPAGCHAHAELRYRRRCGIRVAAPPSRIGAGDEERRRRQLPGAAHRTQWQVRSARSQIGRRARPRRQQCPRAHQVIRTPSATISVRCSIPESVSGSAARMANHLPR